jgi:hypothetical protein
MAINRLPQVVTNGLVFYYDMGNPRKSWKGRPATNFFTNGHFSNGAGIPQESGSNPTNTVIYFPDNPGDTDYVLEQTMGIAFTEYQINLSSELVSNTTYVMSGWYAESADYSGADGSRMFHSRAFSASGANIATGDGIGTVLETRVINGITWRYCYQTITTPADYSNNFNWYLGYSGNTYTGKRYYTNIQMEIGNFPSGFVNGTRSNTQAILDLIGNNTITANSLTYPSDRTFSFNGTSNFINLDTNIQSGYTSASYEFWCRPTALPGSGNYFQLYIQESSTWIALYNVGAGAFFGIDLNNGSGWFDGNGGSVTGSRTTTPLSPNTDYYVAYSWNGSTVSVYLNGNLQATVSTLQAANGRQNVTQLGIGTTSRNIGSRYNGTNNNWVGTISSVLFRNQALSAAEVQQNFNALRGRYGI